MAAGSAVPVPASHLDVARDAEPATKAANAAMLARLPFGEVADFEAARRGLIAPVPEGVVRSASGTVLWNLGEYAFIDGELAPATVNPSLWRMARLNLANGLFKVTDRLYQLRGFDISNMTVIEGDTGLILIDPLTTAEVARAALAHYYAHRPHKPVVAVIYTHSHVDHYGGVRGVIDEADVRSGKVPVIAPAGFMEAVTGENVLAGMPMARRAQFQFGSMLPRGPRGQVDAGLGKGIARGTPGLIAPTPEHRAAGRGAHDRRRQDHLPARARDRGAGRDAHVLSAASACSTWRRTPVRCCTTSSRCAAPWRAIRASGPSISATPSRSTRQTPRS